MNVINADVSVLTPMKFTKVGERTNIHRRNNQIYENSLSYSFRQLAI
jgi:hypothetical protein